MSQNIFSTSTASLLMEKRKRKSAYIHAHIKEVESIFKFQVMNNDVEVTS